MHETNDVIKERTIRNQYYRGNIGFPSGSSTDLPTCNDLLRSIIWYANYIGRDRLPVNFKRPPHSVDTPFQNIGLIREWVIPSTIRTMENCSFELSQTFSKMRGPLERSFQIFASYDFKRNMNYECYRSERSI